MEEAGGEPLSSFAGRACQWLWVVGVESDS